MIKHLSKHEVVEVKQLSISNDYQEVIFPQNYMRNRASVAVLKRFETIKADKL